MTVFPVRLSRLDERQLEIEWNDGRKQQYSAGELRKQCPCATCREKHTTEKHTTEKTGLSNSLPILSEAEARPLRIEKMRPVGNYAYAIEFSDGHNSGIYPFDLLRSLGTVIDPGNRD